MPLRFSTVSNISDGGFDMGESHQSVCTQRTVGSLEILFLENSNPTASAFLKYFHVVDGAELSHIILDLLPGHIEW